MNSTNNDKSDYRIANRQLPLQPLHTSNDTLLNMATKTDTNSDTDNSSSSSSINNFNNDNLTTNPINSTNSRFATIQSSPSLEDSTNTVSIASLNVRGISSSTKFNTILEDLMRHSFSAIGLQETKIKESTGISLYKNFSKRARPFPHIINSLNSLLNAIISTNHPKIIKERSSPHFMLVTPATTHLLHALISSDILMT